MASTPVEALGRKFHAPTVRSGMVVRSGLVNRLLASEQPVITVVAPPGYGKTTVLAQWAERLRSRVAWVSCERADNDPVALWTAVMTALGIAVMGSNASQLLATSGGGVDAVAGLVAAFAVIEGSRVSWCSTTSRRSRAGNAGLRSLSSLCAFRRGGGWLSGA